MEEKARELEKKFRSEGEMLVAGKKQCPACGKHVDKERRVCPECTAQFSYRVKESTLVKGSLIFVVIGVVFFLIAAYGPSGITNVEDMDTNDNFSILTFKGKVVEAPDYDVYPYQEYGEMKFDINDTTGIIQVLCNSRVTEELIENGKIPSVGDTIEVTGRVLFIESVSSGDWENITISEEGLKLYLERDTEIMGKEDAFKRVEVMYEDNLQIERPNHDKLSVSQVDGQKQDAFELGKKVRVTGIVASGLTNYSTAYQFNLKDPDTNDKLLVYIPKSLVELSGIELYSEEDPIINLKPLSEVTIRGALIYYTSSYGPEYDKWELIPTYLGDKYKVKTTSGDKKCLEIIKEGENFGVDMLLANKNMFEGASIHLENVRISKNGSDLKIKDPGGQDELLVYSYDKLDDFALGTSVEVEGQFIVFGTTWEIKISKDYHYIREVV
ncbi:MAG: hypothetical protein QF682_02825 [Candidatus Thermoplasmatota archaeon]|jgi:predicted nucleic acid-binding Zn ribbon protein|nr:hypothetical protein [Candidatus Thermoplasmatota archaeon]